MNKNYLLTRLQAVCGDVTIKLDRKEIDVPAAEELATKEHIRVLREACPAGVFAVSVKISYFLDEWVFTPEVIPYNQAAEDFLGKMGFDQPYLEDQEAFNPDRGWIAN